MKKLIILLLFLTACKPDDPQPTSLAGGWSFNAKSAAVGGALNVVVQGNAMTAGGTITIKGHTYQIPQSPVDNPPGGLRLVLFDNPVLNGVILQGGQAGADLRTIVFKDFQYIENYSFSPVYQEKITLGRN